MCHKFRRELIRSGFVLVFLLGMLPGSALRALTSAPQAARAMPSHVALADGQVISEQGTGRVFIYWAGIRHWIEDPSSWTANGFIDQNFTAVSQQDMNAIPQGNALRLHLLGTGLVYPLSPVLMPPVTMSLGQASVVPGQTFSLTGAGFLAGEGITIVAPGAALAAVADRSGSFTLPVLIPTSVGLGLQRIYARGNSSGTFGLELVHVVAPSAVQISAVPSSVPPTTSTRVTGSGFQPGEAVDVFLSTFASAEIPASVFGAFGPIGLAVPANTAPGSYPLLAIGRTSGLSTATSVAVTRDTPPLTPTHDASADARPSILLNAASAFPGTPVSVSGAGYLPGEPVVVLFGTSVVQHTAADSRGAFARVVFLVPGNARPGAYAVTVTGTKSARVASAVLTVAPVVVARTSLSPTATISGGIVVFSGTGFAPREQVLIRVDRVLQATVVANSAGAFSVRLGPRLRVGKHAVSAFGNTSGRASTSTLQITAQPKATIAVSPRIARPGSAITVTGAGFTAREIILVSLRGAVLTATNADASGQFSLHFTLPKKTAGGTALVGARGIKSGREVRTTIRVV